MTDDDKIRAAWERYHGPVSDLFGDEIPQAPPAYVRGYRDGYAAHESESRAPSVSAEMAQAALDAIQDAIGCRCRTIDGTMESINELISERDSLKAEIEAAERERCAQIVERVHGFEGVREVAERIRAKSK